GQAQMLSPTETGVRGNSHMIMQDKNNLQIADLILKWIDERVSKRTVRQVMRGKPTGAFTTMTSIGLATGTLASVALLASVSTEARTIVVTHGGSRAVRPAPAENLTGGVRVEVSDEHDNGSPLSPQEPTPAQPAVQSAQQSPPASQPQGAGRP